MDIQGVFAHVVLSYLLFGTSHICTSAQNEVSPEEQWKNLMKNLSYSSWSNSTNSQPSYVLFEKEAEGLVKKILDKRLTFHYKYNFGNNMMIFYQYISWKQKGFNNSTFSVDMQQATGVDILPSSIKHFVDNSLDAIVLIAKFGNNSLLEKLAAKNSSVNDKYIVSDVISISVFSVTKSHLISKTSVPISYNISVPQTKSLVSYFSSQKKQPIFESLKYTCVFFNLKTSSWSDYGCMSVLSHPDQNSFTKRCSCNHTTSFSVIMSLQSVDVEPALNILIIVSEVISVVALAVTIIILLFVQKSVETERFITQIGLATSLMFLHIFFIIGSVASSCNIEILCKFSTVAAHFFTISSAVWMLNEGVLLLIKIKFSLLNFHENKYKIKLLVTGWVLPAIYVAICAISGLTSNTYMISVDNYSSTYQGCWLSIGRDGHYMALTVIIPLGIVLFINTYVLIFAVITVRRLKRTCPNKQINFVDDEDQLHWQKRFSKLVTKLRVYVILFPVLGIPWFLACLVNIPNSGQVFIALHGSINGLQGFFVFLIICFNKDIREALKRKKTIIDLKLSINSFQAN